MPKIHIYLTQSLVSDDLQLKDKNIVVNDALRATSTMTYALNNGAKEIIAAETPSKAAKIKRGAGASLLCGEKAGQKIDGFDLGNSPFEFTPEVVKNKSLIFSTTNGTISIIKSRLAKNIVLASFLNITKAAEFIKSINEDVYILCSGKQNDFCLEDFICAGVLIKELQKITEGEIFYFLSDSENAAVHLAESYVYSKGKIVNSRILEMFSLTEHGQFLKSLGFESDLEFCSQIDSYPVLPIFYKDVIKIKEQIDLEILQRQQMKKINLKDSPQDK